MSRPDFQAKVTLKATLSPSEDPDRVAKALENVVDEGPEDINLGSDSVVLRTKADRALLRIRDKLRDRHVRAAARRQLFVSTQGNRASIMLNRQAAAAGVVALCGSPEESPLGPIYLTIESNRLEQAVRWLTAYEDE